MPTVKYYGFHYPPYGTMDVLNHFDFNRDAIFYILDPLAGPELPYEELKGIDPDCLFVIVQTGEGHSHKEFDILLDILLNQVGMHADHITLHTACLYDPDSPVNTLSTIAPLCGITVQLTECKNYTNHIPTHHYVCLNRLPRWEREEIVETLLSRGLDKFGSISYASGLDATQFRMQYPDANTRFPMYIDDVVSFEQGYNTDNNSISNAMFNIVTESAYEQPATRPNYANTHVTATISEKTYKTFLTGQIPVFVAPYHTVTSAKEFGFDMFDDIIDHGYDLESDPVKRIQMVADQVEKICRLSTSDLQQLKEQLTPRLLRNYERVHYWANNHRANIPRWQKYFNEVGILA